MQAGNMFSAGHIGFADYSQLLESLRQADLVAAGKI